MKSSSKLSLCSGTAEMPNNVPLPLSIFGESLFVIADPIEGGNEGKRKKRKNSTLATTSEIPQFAYRH